MCSVHPTTAARLPRSATRSDRYRRKRKCRQHQHPSRSPKIRRLWPAGPPGGLPIWPPPAATGSRFACRAARPRAGFISCSAKARTATPCHGTVSTGSGAMNALCLGTTRTAITGWCMPPCSDERQLLRGTIHGIAMIGTPAEAAAAYERVLKSYYGSENLDPARPLFDIQILGLGPDGHTASLIPGTSVLEERQRWVAEVIGGRPEPRITLTYPVLESSRHTAFL